jgi:Transposase, Mutator family
MEEAEEDVLTCATFPAEHWQKVWSNNPLERLNKEVKSRTNVVGIFPNEAAVVRLVGAVLREHYDEWQVAKRYFSAGSLGEAVAKGVGNKAAAVDGRVSSVEPCKKRFTRLTGHILAFRRVSARLNSPPSNPLLVFSLSPGCRNSKS